MVFSGLVTTVCTIVVKKQNLQVNWSDLFTRVRNSDMCCEEDTEKGLSEKCEFVGSTPKGLALLTGISVSLRQSAL